MLFNILLSKLSYILPHHKNPINNRPLPDFKVGVIKLMISPSDSDSLSLFMTAIYSQKCHFIGSILVKIFDMIFCSWQAQYIRRYWYHYLIKCYPILMILLSCLIGLSPATITVSFFSVLRFHHAASLPALLYTSAYMPLH